MCNINVQDNKSQNANYNKKFYSQAGGNLPLSQGSNLIPQNGIVGAADNIASGFVTFGNAQGTAVSAVISSLFNAFGSFVGGTFGSGAFFFFRNQQPNESGVTTT